jgi:hypothetical protein
MKIQTLLSNTVANSSRRVTQFETWTWGLANAVVVGGSTSVTSWLGMAAAKGVGVDVPSLNFKALGVIFLSGAGLKFFAYLAQGLPALTSTVETSRYERSADGSVVGQTSKTTIVTPVDATSGLTPDTKAANNPPSTNQPP